MQDLPFDKAAKGLVGDIVLSRQPPFGSFAPAEGLKDFYRQIEKQGAILQGGFAFGGAFADLGVGRKPNDYDLYIVSPNTVRRLNGYRDQIGHDGECLDFDGIQQALGFDLPFYPDKGLSVQKHADILGDHFEFTGGASIGGVRHKIDLKIGTKNPSLSDFLRDTPAPIMAAAMALDRDDVYAYHRDFIDHAIRGILCTDRAHERFAEKAARKGLELITPAALAARDAQAQDVPGVHVAKNGDWRPVV